MQQLLSIALLVLVVYLALGALFALPFSLIGAGRVDPDARGGSWGFRVLIIPGAALFWPLLALRWAKAGENGAMPQESTPHKRLWAAAGTGRGVEQ